MPNKTAAMKSLRQSKKRQVVNSRIKTDARVKFKNIDTLIKEGKLDEAKKLIQAFQKAIDKAAKNNVISKNKASRKKSSLMKKLSKKA
jgi:small subunit ribosomal protein S20